MKISVEFVGPINIGPYQREQDFEVEDGIKVEDFLKTLKHFHPSHIPYIQVLCNRKRCSHTKKLKEGDKLELMIMVGGG
jgi:sulfur carrier protein ThiS